MSRSPRSERLRAAWQFALPVEYPEDPTRLHNPNNGSLYNEFDYHELNYRHVDEAAHLVLGAAAYQLSENYVAAWKALVAPAVIDLVADRILPELREAIRAAEPNEAERYQIHLSYPLGQEAPYSLAEHRLLMELDEETRLPCCHREWIQSSSRRVPRIQVHVLLSYFSPTSGQREVLRRIYQPPCIFDTALSEREQQIASGMVRGMNSKAIAAELFLSKHTIDTHRRTIIHKIGVENTAELILLANELNWRPFDPFHR